MCEFGRRQEWACLQNESFWCIALRSYFAFSPWCLVESQARVIKGITYTCAIYTPRYPLRGQGRLKSSYILHTNHVHWSGVCLARGKGPIFSTQRTCRVASAWRGAPFLIALGCHIV